MEEVSQERLPKFPLDRAPMPEFPAAPPDPADVEDMRLRIEAHQRASEAEAASARAFRSECERAHGEFLRACARLEEERRARHAKQLEVMEATYARARLATPAVSAESPALRGPARGSLLGFWKS